MRNATTARRSVSSYCAMPTALAASWEFMLGSRIWLWIRSLTGVRILGSMGGAPAVEHVLEPMLDAFKSGPQARQFVVEWLVYGEHQAMHPDIVADDYFLEHYGEVLQGVY